LAIGAEVDGNDSGGGGVASSQIGGRCGDDAERQGLPDPGHVVGIVAGGGGGGGGGGGAPGGRGGIGAPRRPPTTRGDAARGGGERGRPRWHQAYERPRAGEGRAGRAAAPPRYPTAPDCRWSTSQQAPERRARRGLLQPAR